MTTGFEGLGDAHRFLAARPGMARYFLPGGAYCDISDEEAVRSARGLGWDGNAASVPEAVLSEHAAAQGWSLAEEASVDEWRGNMRVTPYMEDAIKGLIRRAPAVQEREVHRGLRAPDGVSARDWAESAFPVGGFVPVASEDRPFASFTTSAEEAGRFSAGTVGRSAEEGLLLRMRSGGGLDVGSRNEREVVFEAHFREVLAHETDPSGRLVVVLGEERDQPAAAGPSTQERLAELQHRHPELYESSEPAGGSSKGVGMEL
ncbi:hypothetical protein [Leucobacter tenebrionis]|uniref:hypothetical protein n=1 Tax=Leucobacter tenebrionis TaxID=2873270 RepID=UPI001CA639CA|nr:hypothetical protein [Leucobacter tenebrionis]QZY52251.1 hypothetical protein KVY00_01910 [Leucobacter tenebrionis]